jgi:4'-phosphopantetheinyl transferase
LSTQEIERYERFNFDKDRHNYLVSHALLRHALSKYSAVITPSQWQFSSNAHGKPELQQSVTPDTDAPVIRFNLTHTDGLCACVVTLNKTCGIDAENIHRQNNLAAVARRMFADEELKMLHQSADEKQQFFNFWTLREAYVKALGTGLAGSSKDYYFSLDTTGSLDSTGSLNTRGSLNASNVNVGNVNTGNVNTGGRAAVINYRNRRLVGKSQWHFHLFEPTNAHCLAIAFESDESMLVHISELVP